MNVLYIDHYVGHPEYGMEFRPFYLARQWQKNGHKALLLGADFSHLRRKNPDINGLAKKDGVSYFWIKTPAYEGNGFGRVLNIFAFVIKIFLQQKQILSHISPDVVVASSTYPFDIFPAWWIARRKKAVLVFEIHDLWPLTLIELGGMSKFHPFVLLVGLAEKAAYKLADKVISVLPDAFQHARKFGVKDRNFLAIPNGIDNLDVGNIESLPELHQAEINRVRKQGRFLVGYAGAHSVANALHSLIDAAKLLEQENVHVVFVGDGQGKQVLVKYARDIANISFLDRISKNAVPSFLSQMDALYVGSLKKDIYKYGVNPNKVFDYMIAGKPIINAISAGNNLVDDAGAGMSAESENVDQIAAAILALKNKSSDELRLMGERGREFVLKNHDYKVLAEDFIKFVSTRQGS